MRSGRDTDLLAATFRLHASLSLSDRTLAGRRRRGRVWTPVFTSTWLNTKWMNMTSRENGMRVVDRLAAAGVLGPKSIVAHAIPHRRSREMELLGDTGTWVTISRAAI